VVIILTLKFLIVSDSVEGCLVCQTLDRKKKALLGQKMPFVKGKGRGWNEDAFSSEDGWCMSE